MKARNLTINPACAINFAHTLYLRLEILIPDEAFFSVLALSLPDSFFLPWTISVCIKSVQIAGEGWNLDYSPFFVLLLDQYI